MKWLAALMLVAFVGVDAQRFQRFPESELEMAPYSVAREAEGYEERLYPARSWACASQTGRRSGLFMKVFRYISGINSLNQAIPMTRPVTTLYEPAPGAAGQRITMCFYINEAYQPSPPPPTEEGVFIQQRPDLRIIALREDGDWLNEQQWDQMADRFETLARAAGETDVDYSRFYRAGYDSPMVRRNRRNEIWFAKQA